MFSRQIGLKPLAMTCRSLSTMLFAGVDVQKALRTTSQKMSDPRCREALEGATLLVAQGEDLASSFAAQDGRFPPLMLDMMQMADQTGSLPEVLESLAEHFDNNLRLRRTFLSAIAWPAFEFIAAVFVIALMIMILGWIGTFDPLGWGLLGTEGALTWLGLVFGTLAALFVGYKVIEKLFAGRKVFDRLWLSVPVLGNCLRSFAIARFSWAFSLTQNTGMPIENSLNSSLRATGNGAFQAASPLIEAMVGEGEELSTAFRRSGLFPEDFLNMVEVAETSGTVPEQLKRLSPQFEEQARRSLSALVAALGWVIWLMVAGMIIFVIFRIMLTYVGMLNDAAQGI